MFHAAEVVYVVLDYTAQVHIIYCTKLNFHKLKKNFIQTGDELSVRIGNILKVLIEKKESERWWYVKRLYRGIKPGEESKDEGLVPSACCALYPLHGCRPTSLQ
jgi:hypothetical protein